MVQLTFTLKINNYVNRNWISYSFLGNTKLGGKVNELNKITVIVKDYFYKFDSHLGYGILENMITGYKVELDSEATNKCNHSNKWVTYYIVENRTFLDKGV